MTNRIVFLPSWSLALLVLCLGQNCRGFSPNKIQRPLRTALNVIDVSSLHAIGEFYEKSPTEAAMLTCAAKASGADLVAQFRQRAKALNKDSMPMIEMDRTLGFLLYGAFYQGLAQHFIYNHLFTDLFGDGRAPLIVATKVLFDMAIVAPNLPLPLSYSIKSIMTGDNVGDGLQKYVKDVVYQDLLFKYWAFWIPVQSMSFSVVPDHLRIPFMAAFSFLWMTILSSTMSSNTEDTVEKPQPTKMEEWFSNLPTIQKSEARTKQESKFALF